MLEKAKQFAKEKHKNQKYGELPYYEGHVLLVFEETKKHSKKEEVLVAALLHDVVEDCNVSLDEIEKEFGVIVRDLVYRLTDEPGKNRKQRKLKTYPKIAANEDAILIKLCDRLVNLQSGGKLDMYRKEHSDFMFYFYREGHTHTKLWKKINKIIVPGLFSTLTPEQQKYVLSYDGPENFGDPNGPKL